MDRIVLEDLENFHFTESNISQSSSQLRKKKKIRRRRLDQNGCDLSDSDLSCAANDGSCPPISDTSKFDTFFSDSDELLARQKMLLVTNRLECAHAESDSFAENNHTSPLQPTHRRRQHKPRKMAVSYTFESQAKNKDIKNFEVNKSSITIISGKRKRSVKEVDKMDEDIINDSSFSSSGAEISEEETRDGDDEHSDFCQEIFANDLQISIEDEIYEANPPANLKSLAFKNDGRTFQEGRRRLSDKMLVQNELVSTCHNNMFTSNLSINPTNFWNFPTTNHDTTKRHRPSQFNDLAEVEHKFQKCSFKRSKNKRNPFISKI